MAPYISDAAKKNLQKGIGKMNKAMTPAAQVRRDFRLGRPAKPGDGSPLHPAVVWQKATDALANFRFRMVAANLNPADAEAIIVFVAPETQSTPRSLPIEAPGKSVEQMRSAAFAELSREGVFAVGMLFDQFDEQSKQQATFPYQLQGLNESGVMCLRAAATMQVQGREILKRTE